MDRRSLITFAIVGFLVGLLVTWHFSTDIAIEGGYPSDEVAARDELLKSYLEEQSYLQSRIVSLRKQIEESQTTVEAHSETANFVLLESLKKEVGLTEMTGSGLEIVLDDGPYGEREDETAAEAGLIQASDVRDIVNILNAASADAIAVNNQRVIASSPISSVGSTILVNNSHITPPFVISAIGDQEIMLQRLSNESLLPDLYNRMKLAKIVFQVYKKPRLSVPVYNGDLKTAYINLVKND